MRIYIIGNDGITLCREPPAVVSEGEIVVASNEELHAARLSGKRLRSADRSAVVGDRGVAGAPTRREAPVEAGRGHCDAASTRGCNGR